MTSAPLPEWAPHEAVWIGFPSDPELWLEDLGPAQAEVAAFARAVHAGGKGEGAAGRRRRRSRGQRPRLAPFATIIVEPFGDIWLRDTAADHAVAAAPSRRAADFAFNGWGGKYDLAGDSDIGARLAARGGPAGRALRLDPGGRRDRRRRHRASCVTTEQCLLNPNRNPGMDRTDGRAAAARDLGFERIVWLGEGLANDHTDGHVDNLARFVAPGRVAIPTADGGRSQCRRLCDAARRLAKRASTSSTMPSPGKVERDGDIIPASYMNFYIGNAAVVVPQYGAANDAAAVDAIQALFPDRKAIGLRADHILTGGGSFHCISQQVPA